MLLVCLAMYSWAAGKQHSVFGDRVVNFATYPGSSYDLNEKIQLFNHDKYQLTMCLLYILTRKPKLDFGVEYTLYEYKGRLFETQTYHRDLDQFEIIEISKSLIAAGADVNGQLPEDYAVELQSGSSYEYRKGDNAVIVALKSGYEHAAFALCTYTNHPAILSDENKRAVKSFVETNSFPIFRALWRDTDQGLLDRTARRAI